ncbi:Putative nucleosome assembly protein (NAP) [Septoria linicola]|uniref:Nucleosome assembly protein (NAP) n=1 Tax=Septoria linicola TaxID=215465 RepID=A0A9Q9AKW7_9PEZI|nr:Putative nucleosome assembly protein (NAP) [Septoria linicola]
MAEENEVMSQVTYEELASIESEFEDIDNEIMKKQYEMSKAAYAKRAAAISKIPNFWPLVIEASPPEIDGFVHPQDSKIFADSLTNISVTRHELDATPQGHPRSVTITLDFKENDFFTDSSLSKKFWYRRAQDGWVGLVSEPVKINWKKGQDPTEGLVDGAHALFEARKKTGDMASKGLPEYTALKKKTEHSNGQNTSFFSWFGFVSSRRWVSAEEAKKADAEHTSRLEARKRGEKVEVPEEEDDEEDEDNGDQAVEVFDNGDDLATTLAEEIWPNAIKYFTQAQEMGDEELSELDFEDMEEDDDGDDEPVDIRALVADKGGKSKRQSDAGPPAKKQKK